MLRPNPRHETIADLLATLAAHEEDARRHCTTVARRLELGRAAVLLLEIACHADAALSDLPELAASREVPAGGAAQAITRWAHALCDWISDAVHEPRSAYRATLAAMLRGVRIAERLAAEASARGDDVLAEWCEAWVSQRAPLLARLAQQIEIDVEEEDGAASAEALP